MKLKLVLALSALASMPAFGQPQQGGTPPTAPKLTLAQVQKVVQIIRGDKVKTEQYCDIEKLVWQIAVRRGEIVSQGDHDRGQALAPAGGTFPAIGTSNRCLLLHLWHMWRSHCRGGSASSEL
jgi:hypothetical protein